MANSEQFEWSQSIREAIQSQTLDLEPSCIAFAPADSGYFVVGAYHLDQPTSGSDVRENHDQTQGRSGSLTLCRLDGEQIFVEQTYSINAGVLDIAFSPLYHKDNRDLDFVDTRPHHSSLAVALSRGRVDFFDLEHSSSTQQAPSRHLVLKDSFQPFDENILVLDVIWHPTKTDVLAATLSTGEVVLCTVDRGVITCIQTKQLFSHALEAWVTAYSADGRFLYSGGDDCVLACHYMDGTNHETIWKDSKIHSAGVTAILPILVPPARRINGSKGIIVTGSYDDRLRVVAAPPDRGKRPVVLAELDLGGGVWRLTIMQAPVLTLSNSDPELCNRRLRWTILASCMYAGARIVEIEMDEEKWEIKVLAIFEEHQSMNYGSDVRPNPAEDDNAYDIVSTSFYDKLMCLWRFDPSNVKENQGQKSVQT
ncbi:MAG: hypothetical protein M1821_002347 [Bathelium mastoideum]|nr:MAG: hypothetical protein M1821_002347 [Bathelium mastoideum]